MNFFRALIPASQPAASADAVPRAHLPELNGFVEVAVGDSRERLSVPVDALGSGTFSTRVLPGLRAGGTADFLYSNAAGRFRFSTVCAGLDARQAHFKFPSAIKVISNFAAKRGAVRLESMMPVEWRYAPGGAGNGEFVKGSMTDLSRAGSSLVVARDLKIGTSVELRFTLKSGTKPLVVLGQVMRASKIESSGKNAAGIRFVNLDLAGQKAIDEYINDRQAVRRDRGVV